MINHQSPYSYAVYNAQSDETHCHSTGFFTFPLSITHTRIQKYNMRPAHTALVITNIHTISQLDHSKQCYSGYLWFTYKSHWQIFIHSHYV